MNPWEVSIRPHGGISRQCYRAIYKALFEVSIRPHGGISRQFMAFTNTGFAWSQSALMAGSLGNAIGPARGRYSKSQSALMAGSLGNPTPSSMSMAPRSQSALMAGSLGNLNDLPQPLNLESQSALMAGSLGNLKNEGRGELIVSIRPHGGISRQSTPMHLLKQIDRFPSKSKSTDRIRMVHSPSPRSEVTMSHISLLFQALVRISKTFLA